MVSVTLVLALAAFVCVVASALGKCPLWIGVLLSVVVQLLAVLPR